MRIEQEVMAGKIVPFTLEELLEFRQELEDAFGGNLDELLVGFAERFRINPQSVPQEDRDVAYKIFWMMKLIPLGQNQN